MPSLETAHLTVHADLHNASGRAVKGVLAGKIEGIHFQQDVEIGPRKWKRVTFTPDKFPQLNFSRPRLWWPWQLGTQPMYEMRIEFTTGGHLSDSQTVRFGIREVTSELTPEGFRLCRVNGRKIFFATVFTLLNIRGIKTSARINMGMAILMGAVVVAVFVAAARYVFGCAS